MTLRVTDSNLIDIDALCGAHQQWTLAWHAAPTAPMPNDPWRFIEVNHRMNFDLWHEEDMARRDDLGAERVRQAKRSIDRCNQLRNDAIEQIDNWFLTHLPKPGPAAVQHSETPGMIIDRLSILALKLFHMRIEAARESAGGDHRTRCEQRCVILEEQLRDLRRCLVSLLAGLQSGARFFKLYRQLKMYNDASLNPQLYTNRS